VLAKTPNDVWLLLSEAAVYASTYASHVRGDGDGLLRLEADRGGASGVTPFVTPWRVAMVGASLAPIVESTLIENLNPASELDDTSWIESGRSAWSWWSGDSTSDYDTQVEYVDFAASQGWEYYLCDEGWQESWMPDLVDYASSKGVGIWLWINGDEMDSEDKVRANLERWAGWGIKGVKVDYVFDQLETYDLVARIAAEHHIMVNFHGCTKPSGERRRYPHLMTREAIYGAEQYKTGHGPSASFNAILPFTRNVQGPMDYTPVTYSDNGHETTWAHQTALDVVFESGVQHLADSPPSYEDNIAKDFLAACPAAWDQTRLLEGEPGSHVTLARRKGMEWYVGAISGGEARTASIDLGFLGAGEYDAELYRDGDSDTEQVREEKTVTREMVLEVPLRAHGGAALRLSPK
jgi:alpha-glucosidase